MSNNSYFKGIADGVKTLAIGMKTTMKAVSYTHLTLPTILLV